MNSAIEVNDSQSNRPELITAAVQAIGRSVAKRKVFEAIYTHKKRTRSVVEIAGMTNLGTTRVLQVGGELAGDRIVNQSQERWSRCLHSEEILSEEQAEDSEPSR
jgi:hypothetical protein